MAVGVSSLVSDIRSFGTEQHWFWASAAISLLAELMFAANSGGTFANSKYSNLAVTPLRILRNATERDAGSGGL